MQPNISWSALSLVLNMYCAGCSNSSKTYVYVNWQQSLAAVWIMTVVSGTKKEIVGHWYRPSKPCSAYCRLQSVTNPVYQVNPIIYIYKQGERWWQFYRKEGRVMWCRAARWVPYFLTLISALSCSAERWWGQLKYSWTSPDRSTTSTVVQCIRHFGWLCSQ